MREDPIIFEDWKVGNAKYVNFSLYKKVDAIFSIVFTLNMFIIGLAIQNGTILFTWLFASIIILFLEVITNQENRTVLNRLTIIIILGFLTILSLPTITLLLRYTLINVILSLNGILLALKFVLLPIVNDANDISGEVLEPRNEMTENRLMDQIHRLEGTEFEILSTKKFNKIYLKYLKINLIYYSIPIGVILIFITIRLINPNFILYQVIIAFIGLLYSIILLTILITWLYFKYVQRRVRLEEEEEEKIEIIPVFPEIKIDIT